MQIADDQGVVVPALWTLVGSATEAQDVEHQHTEVTGEGPSAFAHQGRDRHATRFTALLDGCHDVVGVVLQGVVGGGCGGAAAAVVVDAKATTDVEIPHRGAKAVKFSIDLPGFLQGILQNGDVVDLAADVEVQQPQIVQQSSTAQSFGGLEQFRNGEPELGPIAHGAAPAACAAG